MKNILLSILVCLPLSTFTHAACKPPSGEHMVECESCGNLEQNPSRGIELAWNELLKNPEMQRELQNKGETRIVLTGPPHSSRGVLFYFVLIRDPTFEIVNQESYSEMLSLQREFDRGFSLSLNPRNLRGEASWRSSMKRQIQEARSRAIRITTQPYELRVLDQNGRGFASNIGRIPRNNPRFREKLVGRNDVVADDKYEKEDCFDDDGRQPNVRNNRGGGTGSGGSGRDEGGRGRGSCNATPHTSCRSDFSDPSGSGVVCHTGGTISCA